MLTTPILESRTGTTDRLSFGQPSSPTLTIVKAMGASSPALLAAQSTRKIFGGTIQLVQHVLGNDVNRLTLDINRSYVKSDATQASSAGQVETVTFVSDKIKLTDVTTSLSGTLIGPSI